MSNRRTSAIRLRTSVIRNKRKRRGQRDNPDDGGTRTTNSERTKKSCFSIARTIYSKCSQNLGSQIQVLWKVLEYVRLVSADLTQQSSRRVKLVPVFKLSACAAAE